MPSTTNVRPKKTDDATTTSEQFAMEAHARLTTLRKHAWGIHWGQTTHWTNESTPQILNHFNEKFLVCSNGTSSVDSMNPARRRYQRPLLLARAAPVNHRRFSQQIDPTNVGQTNEMRTSASRHQDLHGIPTPATASGVSRN